MLVNKKCWQLIKQILVGFGMMLCAFQAFALYTFPGAIPPGCSGSAGVYTCGPLNLQDHVQFNDVGNVTITVNGDLTFGGYTFGSATDSANVTFKANGNVYISFPTIYANIDAGIYSINISASPAIFGNLTNTSGYISAKGTISGNVTSTTGYVALNDKTIVGGNVSSTTGYIYDYNNSTVSGTISSTSGNIYMYGNNTASSTVSCTTCQLTVYNGGNRIVGAVSVGILDDTAGSAVSAGTIYNSSITTLTGNAYVGYYAAVTGNVTAFGSAIIRDHANVTGNIAAKNDIEVRYYSTVTGSVTSNATGSTTINVMDVSTVNGPISANTTGGLATAHIYLSYNTVVNGNVTSNSAYASYIDVYNTATLTGNMTSFGGTLSYVNIWGTINGNVKSTATTAANGDIYLWYNSTRVNGSLYVSGDIYNYGTVTGCAQTTNTTSLFDPNNVYLYFGSSTGGTCQGTTSCSSDLSYVYRDFFVSMPSVCSFNVVPVNFNCVIVGGTADTGHLYTQAAGTSFSIDVVALKSTGAVETNYIASGTKNVTLEFVDGSGATACASRTALSPSVSQTVTFSSTDAGRKTVSNINIAKAYRDLRCRVTDANQSPNVVGCSSDDFAVRPTSFTVTSIDATADSFGTSTTATPIIKAGSNFNLTATTGVVGYDGTPLIDATKVSAHTGATQTGTLSNSFSAATSATGTATGSTFNYSEVGYFKFATNGIYDSSFTAVDSANGDCATGFTASGGKNACSFGNTAITNYFGRFIPDHFAIATGNTSPACGSSFSYLGQDGFNTSFTLLAQNASNTNTQNYTGAFAKLALNNWSSFNFSAQGLPYPIQLNASTTSPTGTWANGSASVTAKHQTTRPSAVVSLSSKCADEWGAGAAGICSFTGTRTVFYGANGIYASGVFTGSVACDNSVFGDPLYGIVKACYLGVTPPPSTASVFSSPTDSDGVTMVSTSVSPASLFRYGRLSMSNSYGSELLPLTMPIEAQYWNGTTYQRNQLDSCSIIPASSIAMSNYKSNLSACETVLSAAGTMNAGKINAKLSAPGAGNYGSVDLTVNLTVASGSTCNAATASSATTASTPWFGTTNPSARGTFGLFKSPVIYMRENF